MQAACATTHVHAHTQAMASHSGKVAPRVALPATRETPRFGSWRVRKERHGMVDIDYQCVPWCILGHAKQSSACLSELSQSMNSLFFDC